MFTFQQYWQLLSYEDYPPKGNGPPVLPSSHYFGQAFVIEISYLTFEFSIGENALYPLHL